MTLSVLDSGLQIRRAMRRSESSRPRTLRVPPISPRPEPGLAKGQMHHCLGPPGPGPAAICSHHHLVMFWAQGNGDRGGLTLIFTASCPLHGSVHLGYSEPHVQPCHPKRLPLCGLAALDLSHSPGPQWQCSPLMAVFLSPKQWGHEGAGLTLGLLSFGSEWMLHSVPTFCPSEASSNPQVCQLKCLQTLAIASSG